jgi:hypothetical protein
MQYQIIAKDKDNTRFVLYIFDDLEIAKNKFEFTLKVASGPHNILINSPGWKSIELQRVETIQFCDIDDIKLRCENE